MDEFIKFFISTFPVYSLTLRDFFSRYAGPEDNHQKHNQLIHGSFQTISLFYDYDVC